jgi:hypothetical protein
VGARGRRDGRRDEGQEEDEHIEANDGWIYQTLEESEDPVENLTYLINLYIKSDNKYNRDEMREIANNMAKG